MIKLHPFIYKHSMNVACALFLSVLISGYFSFSASFWIWVSAFFVSESSQGAPIRQGLLSFIVIAIALLTAGFLITWLNTEWIVSVLLTVYLVCVWFLYEKWPYTRQTFLFYSLFTITLMFALYAPPSAIAPRIMDVVIGASIGLCTALLFQVKPETEFRLSMIPIINILTEHAGWLARYVGQDLAKTLPYLPNQTLSLAQQAYPNWVYEMGFNPGLRAGFRFFLIHLEYVLESFASLYALIKQPAMPELPSSLASQLQRVMLNNELLLKTIAEFLATGTLLATDVDFTSDIVELEAELQRSIPAGIELIDLSQAFYTYTALVRNMKDLRKILLKLLLALPVQERIKS